MGNNKLLEKQFISVYQIPKKKITDKDIIKIIDVLSYYFHMVCIDNVEFEICDYSHLARLPEQYNYEKDDEECPTNIGTGWNVHDAILSLCLNDTCMKSKWFIEDVQTKLTPTYLQIKDSIVSMLKGYLE